MQLITLALSGLVLLGQATQPALDIKSANGHLTAHLSGAPLREVMREVSRLTGIEVVGAERLTGPVSADFADVPEREALTRLLAGVNYVIKAPSASGPDAPDHLVVYVHSLAGVDGATDPGRQPILAPALEAIVSQEADEAVDEKESEDNDSDLEDLRREERFRLERLQGQGVFDAAADPAALMKLLRTSDDAAIRLRALQVLAGKPLNAAALKAFVRALDDDAFEVRSAAVRVLGQATDSESLETVGRLLDKPSDAEHLQVSALRVIAMRADAASIPHLQALVNAKDTESDSREAARQIIGELLERQREPAR